MAPLSPQRKWRAITVATLLLVPAYWAVLAAYVSAATKDGSGPNPGAAFAFGLVIVPFVFIVLAFMSAQPNAAGAVLKAMLLSVLIGIPVSAIAADAVTGLVAGVGAGGIAALRADRDHNWKARALAVALASVYLFVILRVAGEIAVLVGPILPFTSIGVADHISERRRQRDAARAA